MAGRASSGNCCRACSKSSTRSMPASSPKSADAGPATASACSACRSSRKASEPMVRMAYLAIVGSFFRQRRGRPALAAADAKACSAISANSGRRSSTTRPTASPRGAGSPACNPAWPRLITKRIGDGWVADLDELRKLAPLGRRPGLPERVAPGEAGQQGAPRRSWCSRNAGVPFDPTRSSTSRSSASTSTSASCSISCTSIHLYDRIKRGDSGRPGRRAASSSAARRRRATSWPSASSS